MTVLERGILENPHTLLQRYFGLSTFRPGQREVIEALASRGAALAVFPTGGGKSLCYQLPALAFDGVTLVVSPLIALMKDQIDYLQQLGIAAARMDSSLHTDELHRTAEDLRSGKLRLLYVAPERFNNEGFLADLHQTRIALFAVDEAHCISEWGHNFRPEYLKLAQTARELGAERVLALTATATPTVVQDICASFGIAAECAVVTGFHRPNLLLRTTPLRAAERDAALVQRLMERPPGPTIVYVTLQKTAEHVADVLRGAGLMAQAYHAGMDAEVRSDVQNWWTSSQAGIVVATIAFGMGIDKADVRYVYHYNLPKSLESYSQEIGRAGRDGLPSVVEVLACASDVPTLENFAYGDTPTRPAVQSLVTELLDAGAEFDVSVADLAARFDVRQVVVRTLLTYLELLGVWRQGTPFYAAYELRPLIDVEVIFDQFSGGPRRFLQAMFQAAKKGRLWYRFDPELVATQLEVERQRVVRALHHLEDRQLVELRASEARLRFKRVDDPPRRAAELVEALLARFERRERQEVERIQQVLALVEHAGCQTDLLTSYFGEQLPTVCGHCSFCETRQPRSLPSAAAPAPIEALVEPTHFRRLCDAHPRALGEARQQARFLCGLSSPALSQARLSAEPMFGVLAEHRFGDVLAWCGSASCSGGGD
jgi:ATP-dependent DNA helicase RecQ